MGAVLSLAAAPIGMMGTCCGSLLGSCAASLACKACSCACAVSQRTASILYIALLVVSVVASLSFRYSGGDIVIGGSSNETIERDLIEEMQHAAVDHAVSSGQDWWNQRFGCAAAHPGGWVICCASTCSGDFSVYRFSFTLCLFFASLALLTVGKSRIGATAHRGFWLIKAFVLMGLLVSTLFIENETLVGYRQTARYLSFGFLVMQLLLIIEFGYTMNETWLAYDEASDNEGCCGWRLAIVLAAAGLYAASLGGWVFLFVVFGSSACPAQQTLISLTLLFCLGLTALSCSKIAPHGTLLTSAWVTAYCTFLCYSALASYPKGQCNPMAGGGGWDVVLAVLFAAVSMASTAFSATSAATSAVAGTQALVGRSESSASELAKPLDEAADSSSDEEAIEPASYWHYHVMMAMCSLYMAMLLTNWSSLPADMVGLPSSQVEDVNMQSFWVKIVSQWLCLLIYAWTLLAPYLMRNQRDFGIDFSDFD